MDLTDEASEKIAVSVAAKLKGQCQMGMTSDDVVFVQSFRKRVDSVSRSFWGSMGNWLFVILAALLLSGIVVRIVDFTNKRIGQ